jgi:hypothetical protein
MTGYWNAMAEHGWVHPISECSTPPGIVETDERLMARAQIDALVACEFFRLIRDEVDYILETFPTVKEADIARYGDYRTKILVMEQYDALLTTPSPSS